jgi:Bacterial regulatory helix-turn-helix protein, lysR family
VPASLNGITVRAFGQWTSCSHFKRSRVVELGGFTKAAESLRLSKTSVSDLVQNLETQLGVRLLQRTTRRVTVILEGAAFYERCTNFSRGIRICASNCGWAFDKQTLWRRGSIA